MPERRRFRRRKKIIDPGLQLRIGVIFLFVLVSTLVFFAARMSIAVAQYGERGAQELFANFGDVLRTELLISAALGAAITMAVAVAVTFRLAGPVYRMCQFLKGVNAGTETADCRLRKGDAFQDLCTLINEATQDRRARNAADVCEATEQVEPPAREGADSYPPRDEASLAAS